MTTATVAAPQGNQFGVLLAIFLVITFATVVVYWNHERRMDRNEDTLYAHAQQLATLAYQMPALLEHLGVDIPPAVVDDSPAAEMSTTNAISSELVEPDADTEEFPVAPNTVPDGMPLAVHSALIERPSPVPRDLSDEFPHPVDSAERKAKNAADIEERLKQFRFTGGRK